MRLFEGTQWDRPPHCERCDLPERECQCPPLPPPSTLLPPQKQTARLSVEKRKKGKVVTVVQGLAPEATDLPALLTKLKSALGSGGTLQESELEIQGNQLDRVREVLQQIGYRTKG